MTKWIFLFCACIFALDAKYYVDDKNDCALVIWMCKAYEKGNDPTCIICKTFDNTEYRLSVYPDRASFVPLIESGESLDSLIKRIKNLDERVKDFELQGYEVSHTFLENDLGPYKYFTCTWKSKKVDYWNSLYQLHWEYVWLKQMIICIQQKWYMITFQFPTSKEKQSIKDMQYIIDDFILDQITRHFNRDLEQAVVESKISPEEAERHKVPNKRLDNRIQLE